MLAIHLIKGGEEVLEDPRHLVPGHLEPEPETNHVHNVHQFMADHRPNRAAPREVIGRGGNQLNCRPKDLLYYCLLQKQIQK